MSLRDAAARVRAALLGPVSEVCAGALAACLADAQRPDDTDREAWALADAARNEPPPGA